MIEITFTGETLTDVAAQAYAFSQVVGSAALTDEPAEKVRKPRKVEPEKAPAEVDPPMMSDAEVSELIETADHTKTLEKTKEEALGILRTLYNKDAAGQAAVKALLKEFKVTKAADVPVERAYELIVAAQTAIA